MGKTENTLLEICEKLRGHACAEGLAWLKKMPNLEKAAANFPEPNYLLYILAVGERGLKKRPYLKAAQQALPKMLELCPNTHLGQDAVYRLKVWAQDVQRVGIDYSDLYLDLNGLHPNIRKRLAGVLTQEFGEKRILRAFRRILKKGRP